MNEDIARKELSVCAKRLAWRGLVEGSEGNLSIRLDNERILIKPTKKEFCQIEPEDFVVVNLQGAKIAGDEEPSSEYLLHTSIYKGRKDVNSIIHTHPDLTTSLFTKLQEPLKMGKPAENALGISEVAYLPKIKPGSLTLANRGAKALEKSNAVILGGHGLVTVGENLEKAFQRTLSIEKESKWQLVGIVVDTYNLAKSIQKELANIFLQLKQLETLLAHKSSGKR